jgi:site-specific DNA-cytosine methylase
MVLTILDLCSGSGAWSKPYRDKGYDVIEIDVKDDKDVRLIRKLDYPIKGILSAPPCTHLSGSGARWWKEKGKEALLEALSIVDACLRAVVLYKPKWWCLENPVGRLSRFLGKPNDTFHPNDYALYSDNPFSNEYSKLTCLWGNYVMPEKKPGKMMNKNKIWYISPSDNRGQERSVTPDGFAKAFQIFNP